MKLIIDSNSQNEAFARTVVAAYITRLDPTLEELADVKTAVSEAVTNSILHGYNNGEGEIEIVCEIKGQDIMVEITDHGVGIPDIEFMDELEVYSEVGKGTRVKLSKHIGDRI